MNPSTLDRDMLQVAARAAARGMGHVEPNPMVGCVIGRDDGTVLGVGHHRRFGDRHAEVEALRHCAMRGHSPRGATAWVTLEPCNHQGKQPPCTGALIEAGIARVIVARPDPNPVSTGGAERLRTAGIEVRFTDACPEAVRISDAFIMRILHRRPWVIAKWAQTIDGCLADASGSSQWISGERSRRGVHRLRGRVDAILTGIGTVLADDPLLTARGVPRRRIAMRIVIDPGLRIPEVGTLVQTIDQAPLMVVTTPEAAAEQRVKAAALRRAGVALLELPRAGGGAILLRPLLEQLAAEREVSNVLVEGGAGLLGALARESLLDELRIHIGPTLLGDPAGLAPVAAAVGGVTVGLSDAAKYELCSLRRRGADALLVYRRPVPPVT